MKILLFENSAIIKNDIDFCIEVGTGQFSKELKELGNDVTFYGQILPSLPNTTDVYPLLKNGLKVKGSERSSLKLKTYFLLYAKAIPQIMKADFIYMFYPNSLRFLLFLAVIFNKKFGLYIRGIDDLKKMESNFFYRKAFRVFTVADYFTDYINTVSPKKVASTVRPMINFDENDIVERTIKNIQKDPFKVLYLGRMTNDKGVIELLHAAKILLSQNINLEVNLVGSGEYMQELQDLSLELGITSSVHFHGPVFLKEEIKRYYLETDIYILPTYHEGFPRTLYEAMICGTPILTTFVGGIPGLMKNKVNCLELEPKSVESVAQNLVYAYENHDEMMILSENAQVTITEILSTRKYSHARDLHESLKNLEV